MMPTHLFLHKPNQFIMKYGTYQVWDLPICEYNFLIYEQTNQFQSYPSIVFNGLITYPSCCQSIICDSWSVYRWLFCFLNQHLPVFTFIYLQYDRLYLNTYVIQLTLNQNCTKKIWLTNICEIHLYCPIWLQFKFWNL